MLRPVLCAAAAFALASCDPISEEACRIGDWGSIGLADGKKGRSTDILSKYAETCAEFGVTPNQSTYLAARQAGLKFYCTPDNAYQLGRNGSRINPVCEPQVQAAMRPAYDRGANYYEIGEEIKAKQDRIDHYKALIRAIRDEPTPENESQIAIYRSVISDMRHDIFVLELKQKRFASYP